MLFGIGAKKPNRWCDVK